MNPQLNQAIEFIDRFDASVVRHCDRHGHRLHRIALGGIFVWLGVLKIGGFPTVTTLLSHTVFLGDPATVVGILGAWELVIGICLLHMRLVRVAILLLVLRLPGTVLALVIHPEVCFTAAPFVPTPEGQYLIKEFAVLFAAIAIGGAVRSPSTPERRH